VDNLVIMGAISFLSSTTIMAWLLLEAGIAGLLLVLIVWWTIPSKRKPRDKDK